MDSTIVGAVLLTLRDEQNHRFAANFVNLVVTPEQPLKRIQRRSANDVIVCGITGKPLPPVWIPDQSVITTHTTEATPRATSIGFARHAGLLVRSLVLVLIRYSPFGQTWTSD